MRPMQRQSFHAVRGFSLIELMIVVGIIAILAGIGVPSYTEYQRRGQLPDAFAQLSDFRIKMEQFYQDNRNYGTGSCAIPATGDAPKWSAFKSTERFTFQCALTDEGYTLTASGAGGVTAGHEYTVDQAGNRRTVKFKKQTVSKDCWLTKDATTCN